jgi:hypothetical protein
MTKPAQRAARRGVAKATDRAPRPRLTQAAAIERAEGRFGNEVVKSQRATRGKRPASEKVTVKAMATIIVSVRRPVGVTVDRLLYCFPNGQNLIGGEEREDETIAEENPSGGLGDFWR